METKINKTMTKIVCKCQNVNNIENAQSLHDGLWKLDDTYKEN